MYNLLISLVIAALAFSLGMVVAGHWVAGFVPAVLALGIAYVILARRTGNKLQAVMDRAMALVQKQRFDEASRVIEAARPLGRWQFLVATQIDGQLGALAYLQKDYKKAKPYLERSFSRNWVAKAMLAAIEYRERKLDRAVRIMEKISGPAKKEAVFWGLYAYMLVERGKRDQSLDVLARGMKAMPDSEALKAMRNMVSNKKKLRMKIFGQMWYTFFPEHMSMRRYAHMAQQGKTFPMPRR